MKKNENRLERVSFDPRSVPRGSHQIEAERSLAVFNLIEYNSFIPCQPAPGPFSLTIALLEGQVLFDVEDRTRRQLFLQKLPRTPLQRVIRDYFAICESYAAATKTAPPSRVQILDMGRRSLHNDGTELLCDHLSPSVRIDFETGRRLFTLICTLYWKGSSR